jgi:DNA-binding response OmpR family regulator
LKQASTILVVDDDPSITIGLRDNLEFEGYRVLTAGTAREARDTVARETPDLTLLDVMLPDGDGISVCRQLRAQGYARPIIMLTARGEEMDKVLGLEVGADDYVVKPFGLRELLARVRAQLRRGGGMPTEGPIAVGVAVLDLKRHQLSRNGQILEISAKEFELLRYLVERRGQVISRDTLLAEIWGHQAEVATRTVDNFIVRLRKKIEPDPADPVYLLTVYGSGYKLVEQ